MRGCLASWAMPPHYYTRVIEDNGVTVRMVFVDTIPMIDKYHEDTSQRNYFPVVISGGASNPEDTKGVDASTKG